MQIAENIKSSFISIKSHILRTVLTLLGITIGVFAVISLSSTIYIVKSTIKKEMKNLGWDNSITVYASSGRTFNFRRRHFNRRLSRFMYMQRKSSPLTLKDFNDIKDNVPTKYCYAMVNDFGKLIYGSKEDKISMVGTNSDYLKVKKYSLIKGRLFSEIEIDNHIRVCLLSENVAKTFEKDTEKLLDKTVRFGNNLFRVVGIVKKEKKKSSFVRMGSDYEEKEIFVPLTTAIYYFRTSSKVDNIYIQAPSEETYEIMKTRVRQILLRNHNMAHDFSFSDIGSFMLKINNEINTFMKKWSILFITIASVSLLVGGIGLFSTLIISIAERMNEIGIRKSIGAKNSDIFMLFLWEAIILSMIAALGGLGLSFALVKIISSVLKESYFIPMQGILLGFAFSFGIGFLSGLYPAIKASRINPIEAIYYFQ